MTAHIARFERYFFNDASDYRGLWSAVLLGAFRDLCSTNFRDQRDVEAWIGPYPSRDFKQVCAMAGMEWEPVYARMSYLASLSRKERRALYAQGDAAINAHLAAEVKRKAGAIGGRVSRQVFRQEHRQPFAADSEGMNPRPHDGKILRVIAGDAVQYPPTIKEHGRAREQGHEEILSHQGCDQQQADQQKNPHRPNLAPQKQAWAGEGRLKCDNGFAQSQVSASLNFALRHKSAAASSIAQETGHKKSEVAHGL